MHELIRLVVVPLQFNPELRNLCKMQLALMSSALKGVEGSEAACFCESWWNFADSSATMAGDVGFPNCACALDETLTALMTLPVPRIRNRGCFRGSDNSVCQITCKL